MGESSSTLVVMMFFQMASVEVLKVGCKQVVCCLVRVPKSLDTNALNSYFDKLNVYV